MINRICGRMLAMEIYIKIYENVYINTKKYMCECIEMYMEIYGNVDGNLKIYLRNLLR